MTRGFLIVVLLLVSACTPMQSVVSDVDWDARRQDLLARDAWNFRGRIALKDAQGEGGLASLRWEQAGEVSHLRLAGPFGAGAYTIDMAPGRVSITDASGERSLDYLGTKAAENFMAKQLGWYFPIASLRFWLLGLSAPGAPAAKQLDTTGRLVSLFQHGWQVHYERYAEFDAVLLPVKLVVESPQVRGRIVVSKWVISPVSAAQ